jgi:hypothetical protein
MILPKKTEIAKTGMNKEILSNKEENNITRLCKIA